MRHSSRDTVFSVTRRLLLTGERWKILLLGGLRARFGEQTIRRFQTQKDAELLAYLACNPRRTFAREELIELLWPGVELTAGSNRLGQLVSSLSVIPLNP